jgi:hypothetical protein
MITETPKGALCSSWEPTGKMMMMMVIVIIISIPQFTTDVLKLSLLRTLLGASLTGTGQKFSERDKNYEKSK